MCPSTRSERLTPSDPGQTQRRRAVAAQVAFAVVLSYFVASAIASAWVQGALWDLRLFQPDSVDASWRLELAWLAWRGDWSGVDFQYPRGPLWQLYGLLAMQLGRSAFDDGVGWPLALLDAGFHLTTLGLSAWITLTRIPKWGPRLLALLALCLLSRVMGTATLRGLLPILVVLVYAPPSLGQPDAEPLWRAPARAAAVTLLATLFGFDRLYSVGLCVACLAAVELAVRWRRSHEPREAIQRAAIFGAGVVAGLVAIGLVQLALGANPLDALGEHAALNTAYAAHMSMPWSTGVPRAVIATLFVSVVFLAWILGRRRSRDESLAGALWLVGAAPAATFALIRADAGHLIISLLPAFCAFILVAAAADPRVTRGVRQIATGVVTLALFGWFATHPEQMAGDPRTFFEVVNVASGEARPNVAHRTDFGTAARWARARYADEAADACLAVSPGLTFLHPALDRRGPTELSLRWSDEMKHRLAERLVEADCPYFIYWSLTRVQPGLTWPFGEDFLEIARRYEFDGSAGVEVWGLRRREQPLEVARRTLTQGPSELELSVEGEQRIALGEGVRWGEVVSLEVNVEVERWRVLAGGAPRILWRFERDGQPLGEWERFFQLSYGRPSRIDISPDSRVSELWFIAGRPPPEGGAADTLVLRLAPGGMASPTRTAVGVGDIESVRLVDPPVAPTPQCESRVNLAARLTLAEGHTQHGAPQPTQRFFDLDPYDPERDRPEVAFEVTPCPGTCVRTWVESWFAEGEGDGAVGEIFVRDGPELIHIAGGHSVAGETPVLVEASLEDWANRTVELEMTAWPGDVVGRDTLRFHLPQLRPCHARRSIAALIDEGVATAADGRLAALDGDVEIEAPGGRAQMQLRVVRDTCLETGVRLDGADGASSRVTLRVADGDVEHVIDERLLVAGERVDTQRFFLGEFATRDVLLFFDAQPVPNSPPARVRWLDPHLDRCEEEPG